MTLRELIDFVKTLRPGAPFSDSIFITWINELEAEIQSNVFLLDISSMVFHKAAEEAVLADDAHTKVYWMYLCAMIDLANGEYSRYQDDVTIYNGLMSDYRIWYSERYDPANGRAEISGYYISAYSLAVKHGFTGSEEDWLRYISANAETALEAQKGAEAAQKKAETAQKGSEDAAGAALLYKNSAEAAKEASETARRGAEAARTGAETAHVASEGAREGAENALALAGEARTGAEGARDTALEARDGAVAARNAAQEARDAALRAEADAETAEADAETAEAGAVDARAGAEAAERAALAAQEAAEKARGLAEAARTGAETAREGAESAELAAVSAGEAAQAAKGLAELARDNAKAAETGAKLAQESAETARTGAETAQTAAERAKEAAESARSGAVSAKTAAETAQAAAEAARSGAVAAKEAAETARTGAEAAGDSAEASKAAAEAAKTAAQAAETAARAAQSAAEGSALQAEAWARGTEGGVPVASGHPAYQNNSKYYMEQSAAIVGGDYPTRAEAQGYAEEAEARAKEASAPRAHGHVRADISDFEHVHDERYYTQAAADEKLRGKADLVGGFVPSAQLPSYVDDVLEFPNQAGFPAAGESGKIYVALDTNKTYRWSGTGYVEISPSLALGETASTAYRGDRGKAAYEHISDGVRHITEEERQAWGGKQARLTFDAAPTAGSSNPVTSGGVKEYVDAALGDINTILDSINGEVV